MARSLKLKKIKEREEIDWPTVELKRGYTIRALHIQNDCIAMILAGRSLNEIDTFLFNKYGLRQGMARQRRLEAEDQILKRKEWEMGSVINIHLNRYEDIYAKLVELGATSGAGTALKAKEKLLQFHKQSTYLKVSNNNVTQVSIREQRSGFDIEKLEPQKKQRLMELMAKTTVKTLT